MENPTPAAREAVASEAAALETDVLIVGAGPTGLSLAAQLLRYGIRFVIIDEKTGVTDLSKAVVVHARTLEIYDQIGLAQEAIAEGKIARHMVLLHDGQDSAHLDFSRIGQDLSPFPFVLVFEQSKNERLLYDHLQSAGQQVRWQTELEDMAPDAAGVRATIKTAGGEAQTVTQTVAARYVVGCDGAHSTTRHLTGLGFEGSTFPRLFYVADVEMEFEAEPSNIYGSFGPNSFVLFFPMQGKKHWRIIGNLPEHEQGASDTPEGAPEPSPPGSPQESPDVPYSVIETKVQSLVQRPLDITRVRWFSSYKVHTRHADTFSRGRCFLAGDSAHVHTPAGGQGMNTGIQDAYNLAWKLALVLRGQAHEELLETYSEERLANAKRLLQTTDQMFEVAANDHWYAQFFRDHILPGLAGFLWRFEAIQQFIFPVLSQIGITYRENTLSRHNGDQSFNVKAGDRLPFFQVEGASVYDLLHAPQFHLLLFADETEEGAEDYAALQSQIESSYRDLVKVLAVPLSPNVAALFGAPESFVILLRPDNHIGLLSPTLTADELTAYFQQNVRLVSI